MRATSSAHQVDNDGVRHRANAVLIAPPWTAPDPRWYWTVTCDRGCHRERTPFARRYLTGDGGLGSTEAYARAKADARVHEAYPRGVVWVGGAEVWLR